jgi:DNA-binding transcriptional LysR family regulator
MVVNDLANVDLNLLTVFDALFIDRSVTSAAARLRLTQPAVSNALRRLREVFQDLLFVRNGNRMVPTRRAEQIAPVVQGALRDISGVVRSGGFRPEELTGRIRIATLDYLEALLMPRLINDLARLAPRLCVVVTRLPGLFELPLRDLLEGSLDCAIGPFSLPQLSDGRIRAARLFSDRLICLLRADRSNERKSSLSRAEFLRRGHVRIAYPSREGLGLVDLVLQEHGVTRNVQLVLPHFSTLPEIIASTDLISVFPSSAAQRIIDRRLRMVPPPVRLRPWEVSLAWTLARDADPSSKWFRSLLLNAAQIVKRTRDASLKQR